MCVNAFKSDFGDVLQHLVHNWYSVLGENIVNLLCWAALEMLPNEYLALETNNCEVPTR